MVIAAALLVVLPAATSWRAPWPRVWTSEDGGFALAVTPAKHDGQKWGPVRLHFFTVDAEGRQLTLWRSESDFYPHLVKISPDARVVMLNEYPGYSKKTAVAIFHDTGKVVSRFGIAELLTADQFESIPGNEELKPKVWVEAAVFEPLRNLVHPPKVAPQPEVRSIGELLNFRSYSPYALKVSTAAGPILWFDLLTGTRVSP